MRSRTTTLSIAVLVCAVLGCSARAEDLVGTGHASSTCDACSRARCTAEHAACTANADCRAVAACALGARDSEGPSALPSCYDDHPDGRAAFDALERCEAIAACGACRGACAVEQDAGDAEAASARAAVPACFPVDAGGPSACARCAGAHCGGETSRCGASTDCASYFACEDSTLEEHVFGECARDHPEGAAAARALAACIAGACASSCDL